VSSVEKFDRLADDWSEREYADPEQYAARRAKIVAELGPRLPARARILDLACGDGILAPPLIGMKLEYRGVDASAVMIEEARRRHPGVEFELGSLDEYEPDEPVDCTICLRAFYYAGDRAAFFARIRRFTRTKLVFDVRPQVYDVRAIESELRVAGFTQVELRPFLLPQTRRLPAPARSLAFALERSGPLARLVLRRYGSFFCAAS
jgi:SAM-dependent methyltransferase